MAYNLHKGRDGAAPDYSLKWVDGDPKKVELVDPTPDGGVWIGRLTNPFSAGRPIKPDFLATKMRSTLAMKKMPDLVHPHIVSPKFKNIVEQFEPGVHQFFPFDVVTKKGDVIAPMFIMIICNRLDTVHRGETNLILYKEVCWMSARDVRLNHPDNPPEDRLVLDKVKIGDAHLWVDKHISEGKYVSDALGDALKAANLKDVGLTYREEA